MGRSHQAHQAGAAAQLQGPWPAQVAVGVAAAEKRRQEQPTGPDVATHTARKAEGHRLDTRK